MHLKSYPTVSISVAVGASGLLWVALKPAGL